VEDGEPSGPGSAIRDLGRAGWNTGLGFIEAVPNLLTGALPGFPDYAPFTSSYRATYEAAWYGRTMEVFLGVGALKVIGEFGGAKAPPKAIDYSIIENPANVGIGKDFTLRQKQEALALNRAANGGVVKSDLSGTTLVQPQKSQRGVTPNPNEWQLDHKTAKNCGGSNCSSNIQILSRRENRLKSDD